MTLECLQHHLIFRSQRVCSGHLACCQDQLAAMCHLSGHSFSFTWRTADAHLLDSPLLELLLAYEVLQLQLDMPAWHLKGCLLLRPAAGPIRSACAAGCVHGILCESSAEAIALALAASQNDQESPDIPVQLCSGSLIAGPYRQSVLDQTSLQSIAHSTPGPDVDGDESYAA